MAADLPTYSSRDVSITFLGQDLVGLAPDTFVEFSLNSDLTDEEVGGDGSVAISISPDETGMCTLTLQQNSPSNIFFGGVLNLQRAQRKIAKGSFSIKDPSGSVVATLFDAHIKTAPTISLGSSATGSTQVWTIFCNKLWFSAVPQGIADTAGAIADATTAVDTVLDYLV